MQKRVDIRRISNNMVRLDDKGGIGKNLLWKTIMFYQWRTIESLWSTEYFYKINFKRKLEDGLSKEKLEVVGKETR